MDRTQEHLTAVLKSVVAALDEAEISGNLRDLAFAKAFDYLAIDAAAPDTQTRPARNDVERQRTSSDAPTDGTTLVAKQTKTSPEDVERIFDFDDEGVHLTIGPSALEPQKRLAMRQVARLVSAARQAAELDADWTAFDVVRGACDELGVLDSGNFAAAVAGLHGDGLRVRGSGRAREIKVNAAGYEKAGEIIKQLASGI